MKRNGKMNSVSNNVIGPNTVNDSVKKPGLLLKRGRVADIDVEFYMNHVIKQSPEEYLATSGSVMRVIESLGSDSFTDSEKKNFVENQFRMRSDIHDAVSKVEEANKAVAKVNNLDESVSFTPVNEILGYDKIAIHDVESNFKSNELKLLYDKYNSRSYDDISFESSNFDNDDSYSY